MTKISSETTFLVKRVFPTVWFGILGFFVLLMIGGFFGSDGFPAFFVVWLAFMAVVGFVVMKLLVFSLVDEAFLGDGFVEVRKGKIRERVDLTNILNVNSNRMSRPPRVTLCLKEASVLGSEVSFIPKASTRFWQESPVVRELIEKVEEAKYGHQR